MNFPNLSTDSMPIFEAAQTDYFWTQLPYDKLWTALDIGAHIGIWSWLLHGYAPSMQITAIEPDTDNYMALWRNVPHVQAIQGWCGYRQNVAGLCVRPFMSGSHYVIEHGAELPLHGAIVPLPPRYTLEAFGAIDLLKLDCEGSEYDILLNCKDATLDRIRVIVGEYHLEFGELSTLINRLIPFGFAITVKPHAEHLGHFLAIKDTL